MRFRVQSLASLSGLRIQHCRELWCRSQMQLGSGTAVAVVLAWSCSSDSAPSLGTSICCGWGPKKKKKIFNKIKNKSNHKPGVPIGAQGLSTWRSLCEDVDLTSRLAQCVQDLVLPQWVKQHRSHRQLGSTVAMVVMEADSCSSHSTPSLGTSICSEWGRKNNNNNKKKSQLAANWQDVVCRRVLWAAQY